MKRTSARTEHVVAVAKRMFRRKGFRQATMDDLGRALGILKGSLYHHIDSKEALLYRIISETGQAVRGRAEAIRRLEVSIAERLHAAIVSHVRFFGDDPDGMALFLDESANLKQRNRAEVRRIMREYEDVYISLIREGMKAGVFRTVVDPKIVVYGILGMTNGLRSWYDPRGPVPLEDIGEAFADLVLKGLCENQAASSA
jgi:TetR/AcrR family transcriptional regulator, cholesterol catabolism regulator